GGARCGKLRGACQGTVVRPRQALQCQGSADGTGADMHDSDQDVIHGLGDFRHSSKDLSDLHYCLFDLLDSAVEVFEELTHLAVQIATFLKAMLDVRSAESLGHANHVGTDPTRLGLVQVAVGEVVHLPVPSGGETVHLAIGRAAGIVDGHPLPAVGQAG